ncbi:MAG: MMPL family transporter [Acidimicrobiia bacterium]
MRRLAAFVIRRRWWVLIATMVFVPLAGLIGGGVVEKLSVGGLESPDAESARTARALERDFGQGAINFVVVVRPRNRATVDDPAVVAAATLLSERIAADPGLTNVISYFSAEKPPPLRSRDGRLALITAQIPGTEDEFVEAVGELAPRYTTTTSRFTSVVGGAAETQRQITKQAEDDLKKAEALTAPITAVALVVVFGSLVATLLPLSIAVLAVLGCFLALTVIAQFTQVSIFSLNLTTALGLGLAIDYSLFIVSRYREELRDGAPPSTAVNRTMLTAGRTVAFSAATVAVSLAALLVFPMPYLRSFAFAGVSVVVLAGVAAVIVLPALLAVLGTRVDKGRLWRRKEKADHDGFWYGQAQRVMRHPVPYATGVVALLVVLGIPFLDLAMSLPDDRVVPPSVTARAINDELRANFDTRETSAAGVLAVARDRSLTDEQIDTDAIRLSKIARVSRVDASTGYYIDGQRVLAADELSARFVSKENPDTTWFSVVPSVEPVSPRGEALIHDIRATDSPLELSVTGLSAQLVDTKQAVTSRIPLALGLIAIITFILLFLMVGSLLVPLKALLLNFLSLTATFGAMVWIFQEGRFTNILDFTPTGTIDVFTPILVFCIAFGLSMDYEVFLLSRIKEEYDLTGDNQESVAMGLQRTGRIVTAAALLLAIVFIAFSTSKVQIVQLTGIGLTLAVLVDAFLIRATLVPAFMRLAGKANWWAPRAVRRWHLRWGIWEVEPVKILDLHDPRDADSQPADDRA